MPPGGMGGPVAELFASLGIDTRDFEAGLLKAKRDFSLMAVEARSSIQTVQKALKEYGGTAEGLAMLSRVDPFKEAAKNVEAYGQRLREVSGLNNEFQRAIRNRDIVMRQAALDEQRMEKETTAAKEAAYKQRQFFDEAHIQTRKRQLNELNTQFMGAMGRRDAGDQAAIALERRVEREGSAMDRSMSAQRKADEAALSAQFARAMRTRDRTFAQEQGQGQEGGGLGMAGGVLRRMALYAAVYGAGQFAASSLNRVADLERQGTQTGLGFEGAQRLQLAAAQTNTPIEALANAISHMQRTVETLNVSTLKTFDTMGLKAVEVRKLLQENPEAGLAAIIRKIGELNTTSAQSAAFQELFGTKGLKDLEALQKFVDSMKESVRVTKEERAEIQQLRDAWAQAVAAAQDYFSKIVAGMVRIATSPPGWARIVPQFRLPSETEAEFKARGAATGAGRGTTPTANGDDSGPPALPESMERALERFAPTKSESALQGINREFSEVELGKRQGVISDLKFQEAQMGRLRLVQEEEAKEMRILNALLSEFGVKGKESAAFAVQEFGKVTEAFRQGRITIQELQQATANYYDMLERQAANADIREGIRAFKHKLITEQELDSIRQRANAFSQMSAMEDAYAQGRISASQLRSAYDTGEQNLKQLAPDQEVGGGTRRRGNTLVFPYGNSRTLGDRAPYSPVTLPPGAYPGMDFSAPVPSVPRPEARNEMGGQINIIPLDQFSDSMIRRWKQQGLGTG